MDKKQWFIRRSLQFTIRGLLMLIICAVVVVHGQADYPASDIGLVKDINPGSESAGISFWQQAAGLVYFTADDGTHGSELWVSDGTTDGTHLVKDMHPGMESTYPIFIGMDGRRMYFAIVDSSGNSALYITDGSDAGTILLADFGPNPVNDLGYSLTLVTQGKLYLEVDHNDFVELWVSAGTAGSTTKLVTLAPNHSLESLVAGTSRVFFVSGSGYTTDLLGGKRGNITLWSSNGTTTGTRVLKSNFSGLPGVPPAVLGDIVYFSAAQSSPDLRYFSGAQELWKANGISGATQKLYTFPYNPAGKVNRLDKLSTFTPAGGSIFFYFHSDQDVAESGFSRTQSIWRSDGTSAGTLVVKEYSWTNNSRLSRLTVAGNLLYYPIINEVPNKGCWLARTDGTTAGTSVVFTSVVLSDPTDFNCPTVRSVDTRYPGTILFTSVGPAENLLLYRSDGTPGGTTVLKTFPTSSRWYGKVSFYSSIYFGVYVNDVYELWRTDGTEGGTEKIVFPDGGNINGYLMGSAGPTLLFSRSDDGLPNGDHGEELWKLAYNLEEKLYLPAVTR